VGLFFCFFFILNLHLKYQQSKLVFKMLPLLTKSELELLISAFGANTLLDSKNCEVLEDFRSTLSPISIAFSRGGCQIKTFKEEQAENDFFNNFACNRSLHSYTP
jgi:hypothetical protein